MGKTTTVLEIAVMDKINLSHSHKPRLSCYTYCMVKTKLETMKTFDVQWGEPTMPDDVRKFFFDQHEKDNDVWVEHTIEPAWVEGQDEMEEKDIPQTYDMLDQWLLDNTDAVEDEKILLKHWW